MWGEGGRSGSDGRWGDMTEMRGRMGSWRIRWGQLKDKWDTEVTTLEQGPWRTRPPLF